MRNIYIIILIITPLLYSENIDDDFIKLVDLECCVISSSGNFTIYDHPENGFKFKTLLGEVIGKNDDLKFSNKKGVDTRIPVDNKFIIDYMVTDKVVDEVGYVISLLSLGEYYKVKVDIELFSDNTCRMWIVHESRQKVKSINRIIYLTQGLCFLEGVWQKK